MPNKDFSFVVISVLFSILFALILSLVLMQRKKGSFRAPRIISLLRESVKAHEAGVYDGIYSR